ncbi:hypothetical protein HYV74_05070 [Candidatus Uhrbacteria bacterium]|nr:hypothetical protein [Candidatus Uhrbacteria bacterium]
MQQTDALFYFRAREGKLTHPRPEFQDREHLPTIIQQILAINERQSRLYMEARPERRQHWCTYPTAFACIKCMDGRVHLPSITGLPMGLVKPFRAMGGRFEVWWPAFRKRMHNWVATVQRKYHLPHIPDCPVSCGVLVTYHYSASDPDGARHLGCRGWRYDTAAGRAHAERLARDIHDAFMGQAIPFVVGVETDSRSLIFHGTEGDVSGMDCVGKSEEEVRWNIVRAFPGVDTQVAHDLVPFLTGNARRVADQLTRPRETEALGHQERVIAIGHGFDYWISEENLAVVVDDADPNLDAPIAAAAAIVAENVAARPVTEETLLLASVPYSVPGIEWNLSVMSAQGLCRYALEYLPKEFVHVFNGGRLRVLIGVTNEETKLLEPIAYR